MKFLIDTNIFIDHILKRGNFFEDSELIFTFINELGHKGYICPISYNLIWYISKKRFSGEFVKKYLEDLSHLYSLAIINDGIIKKALNSEINDFEDALQYYSAIESNCDYLITRNVKDFKFAKGYTKVITPDDFLKITVQD